MKLQALQCPFKVTVHRHDDDDQICQVTVHSLHLQRSPVFFVFSGQERKVLAIYYTKTELSQDTDLSLMSVAILSLCAGHIFILQTWFQEHYFNLFKILLIPFYFQYGQTAAVWIMEACTCYCLHIGV